MIGRYFKYLLFSIKVFFHNLIFSPKIFFSPNIICKDSFLKDVKFHLAKNTKIIINNSIMNHCGIYLLNEGCQIEISSGCRLKNTKLYCEDENSKILLHNNLTIGG